MYICKTGKFYFCLNIKTYLIFINSKNVLQNSKIMQKSCKKKFKTVRHPIQSCLFVAHLRIVHPRKKADFFQFHEDASHFSAHWCTESQHKCIHAALHAHECLLIGMHKCHCSLSDLSLTSLTRKLN